MTGLIDWASARARMIIAIVALSLAAGVYAYTGLPKEGEPDIEIPHKTYINGKRVGRPFATQNIVRYLLSLGCSLLHQVFLSY